MTDAADPNDWSAWTALLKSGGSPKPDSEVSTGYWRLPNGTAGTAIPIASYFYAPDDAKPAKGVWMATVKGRDIDENDGEEWLSFVANRWPKLRAVSDSDYETALSTGMWPDGTPVEKRDAIGGNSPPEGSVEALLAEAAGHLESAANLIKSGAAKSEADADLAANMAKTLTETKSKVIAAHKVEKQPHLDAGRKVDDRFFPTRDKLDDITRMLKAKVINPWQVEQDRIKREAEAKAKADAEAAAAAGREAEPPPSVDAPKVSAGSRGRKVSLVEEKYAEITSHEALAVALIRAKSAPVITAVEAVAGQLARNAMNVVGSSPADGMVVRSRQVSR
jgi:hypothetical protein